MEQVNLSAQQNPEWALFLPAMSSFFISGLGQQREGENYFDNARIPKGIPDVESLNFINSSKSIYNYKWILYSAGHADLVNFATNSSESVVAKREKGTFVLGDSGGFQILKCQWPADWKDPNCPRAMKKRTEVLHWMDSHMDYGMCLDIPSQSLNTYHIKDPKTVQKDPETGKPIPGSGVSAHGIKTIQDAIQATHINNEYFIKNRTGKCKFLNVMQGLTHEDSEKWYHEMKRYCDPNIYPDNHFNGWALGGQTKIDMHLTLTRIVDFIYDGLLIPGKHDWIHCLGTSILEYAVMFTDIQKAVRKYHNPKLTISFDCASPFFSAAKGLAYVKNTFPNKGKWTYSMEKTAEDKKYATDNRRYVDAVLADKIHETFTSSPVTDKLLISDMCYRGQGFIGHHGKETKTSWDTLSYTLIQAHNVYQHITAVQEANRLYENGVVPAMLIDEKHDRIAFGDVVDEIFRQKDRASSKQIIEKYTQYWLKMKSGSQGFSGKKTINSITSLNKNFEGDLHPSKKTDKIVKAQPKKESSFDDLFTTGE